MILFQVARYGIVTFACPVKVNVIMWSILGQILTLLNIFLRHRLFDYRKTHLRTLNGRPLRTLNEPRIDSPEIENQFEDAIIVLHCLRSTWQRRALHFFTAVLSHGIYTFGTIVLASTALFEAADAVRVVVVATVNAGLGRLVATSSFRRGRKVILIDVSAAHIDRLSEITSEEF